MSLPTGSSACWEVAYDSVRLLAALPTRELTHVWVCLLGGVLPTGSVCLLGILPTRQFVY